MTEQEQIEDLKEQLRISWREAKFQLERAEKEEEIAKLFRERFRKLEHAAQMAYLRVPECRSRLHDVMVELKMDFLT